VPKETPFSAPLLWEISAGRRSQLHAFKINIARAKNDQLQAGSTRFISNVLTVDLLLDYFARRTESPPGAALSVSIAAVFVR